MTHIHLHDHRPRRRRDAEKFTALPKPGEKFTALPKPGEKFSALPSKDKSQRDQYSIKRLPNGMYVAVDPNNKPITRTYASAEQAQEELKQIMIRSNQPVKRGYNWGNSRRDRAYILESDAYKNGRSARASGKKRWDNPFPTGSQDWIDWDEGWMVRDARDALRGPNPYLGRRDAPKNIRGAMPPNIGAGNMLTGTVVEYKGYSIKKHSVLANLWRILKGGQQVGSAPSLEEAKARIDAGM